MEGIWTIAREEQIKQLRAEGRSARAIADEMGCFGHYPDHGRSAVIGNIHRLKLPSTTPSSKGPKQAPRPRPPAASPPQRRTPHRSLPEKIAIAAAEPGLPEHLMAPAPLGTGIKLHQLTALTCRWPIG